MPRTSSSEEMIITDGRVGWLTFPLHKLFIVKDSVSISAKNTTIKQ